MPHLFPCPLSGGPPGSADGPALRGPTCALRSVLPNCPTFQAGSRRLWTLTLTLGEQLRTSRPFDSPSTFSQAGPVTATRSGPDFLQDRSFDDLPCPTCSCAVWTPLLVHKKAVTAPFASTLPRSPEAQVCPQLSEALFPGSARPRRRPFLRLAGSLCPPALCEGQLSRTDGCQLIPRAAAAP